MVTRDQQGERSITCPACRQVTPVPDSGVVSLQSAFQINQLLEIVEEHRTEKAIITPQKKKSASTGPTQQKITCPKHDGRELELYCETCEEIVCYKCIRKGEKHRDHQYEDLSSFIEKEIRPLLEPLERQLMNIEKALRQLDTCSNEISDQRETIEIDIHNTFERLFKTLNVRKTDLINQLHQLTQTKLKNLAAQKDQIETTQAQLSSCLLFMEKNLKTGNQVLLTKSSTVRQVKELTTTFQPDMLEPTTEADIMFLALNDLSNECRKYGKVYAAGSPNPSTCSATGKGVDTAVVGEKSTAVLQTLNFDSQPCKVSMPSISCELISEITRTRVRGSVERRGQGQYEISYQPTINGRHQLHIKVESQHIRGSPFPVSTTSTVENLSSPILTIDGMRGPVGVTVNQRGEVVVTECIGHCVSVFSTSGKRLQSFGKQGSDQGQFNNPHAVAVDGEENILVADSNNHRIQKFTAQGEFLTAVGTRGSGHLQFIHPIGIAVSASNGRVYVVENENNRIQILNSDFSYFGTFGKKGKGQFINPRHIACDSTGNVYVSDHNIQVFTAEGKFLRKFNRDSKHMQTPHGLAIAPCGTMVYSSININDDHHVSVFTSEGQFVTSFEVEEKLGKPVYLRGLAVSNGVLYVCDSGNNRIQLF